MSNIILVTGNPNKLREYQALIPAESGITLVNKPVELTEIQSLNPKEIAAHKLREAYAALGQPVIVDDVSAGLECLGGLPGPFVKYFVEKMGNDALYKLAHGEGERVHVLCIAAFYDGQRMLFGEGHVHGTVVAPRGEGGFGFDSVLVPDGHTRTTAQMTPEEKNAISHRALAIKDLLRQLQS